MTKLAKYALVAFLIWWVIAQPHTAAADFRHLAAAAGHAARSISTLMASL